MFCSNCGKKVVPDGANYCWNCGTSLKQRADDWGSPDDEPAAQAAWERCEIRHAYTLDNIVPSLKGYVTFTAAASGPTGEYTAATSSSFTLNPSFSAPDLSPKPNDFGAAQALEALTAKLRQEGWEQIGEGNSWFNRQFRRRVG
jgi:hypothetical protein